MGNILTNKSKVRGTKRKLTDKGVVIKTVKPLKKKSTSPKTVGPSKEKLAAVKKDKGIRKAVSKVAGMVGVGGFTKGLGTLGNSFRSAIAKSGSTKGVLTKLLKSGKTLKDKTAKVAFKKVVKKGQDARIKTLRKTREKTKTELREVIAKKNVDKVRTEVAQTIKKSAKKSVKKSSAPKKKFR